MREKFIRFMNGRNGMDELARAESWVVMILLVVSIFTRSAILDILVQTQSDHITVEIFAAAVVFCNLVTNLGRVGRICNIDGAGFYANNLIVFLCFQEV